MRERLLPLFPLEVVLLPGATLPLHIFEERYKAMIGEVLAEGGEFGVVQVRDQGILRTGCTASIIEVTKRYEDGRMDILATGERRFEIVELDTEREFLRASVAFFDDDDDTPARAQVADKAIRLFTNYSALSGLDAEAPERGDAPLSFVLGRISPDLDFRQTLLGMRSEPERMEMVVKHLAQLIERRKLQEAMRGVAQSNGHGRHLGGLEDSIN
jgi:Lon protease-like protein